MYDFFLNNTRMLEKLSSFYLLLSPSIFFISLYLLLSPFISLYLLYLPLSPSIFLYLPLSPLSPSISLYPCETIRLLWQ
jgi:hypothetical protein